MKTLLWVVGVLAVEVLLLWGYFALAGWGRMAGRDVVIALLVGTVAVMVWLGFVSGSFEQTWRKLLLAVIGCIVVTYATFAMTIFVDFPAAVVCERGRTPDVEVSSTRIHGYFDQRRIGPCVAFFHHSRAPGGTTAEPWGD